ncbi:MAG: hypothetical protein K9W43_11550 [Candidatus Thorarchaeota archaeon]|nr:hypothetical protein [Candidatus Thorarchaeota archaeon]
MSSVITSLCKKVSQNRGSSYVIGFVGGILAWIPFLIKSGLTQLWSADTLLLLLTISGTVTKFLSGFGIMLTYAAFCSFVFKVARPSLKGNKRRLKVVKLFLLLPAIMIASYAVYVLWHTLMDARALSSLEVLTAIYGLWSLLLTVYVIPALRGQYQPKSKKTKIDSVREAISKGTHKIWKGYQFHIHRDYGVVYASEFERYQSRLDSLRMILGAVLLPLLAVTLVMIPPIAGVILILWIRIFSSEFEPLSRIERLLLVLVVFGVLVLSTMLFLSTSMTGSLLFFNVSYATGIFLSITALGYLVLRT